MHWGPPGKTEKGEDGESGRAGESECFFLPFFEHDLEFGYMAIPCSKQQVQ